MERRYDPKVPIEISDDDREIGICSANHKKLKQEIKKIGVKVVKKSNPILKREEEVGEEEAVTFKIEIDIPLRWVMIGYCQKLGLDFQTTRFEFNGAKLREMDTPRQLAMVSDDVIFAFPILGGYGYSAAHYATLCIRMHKEKDTFVRVSRSTAILPQLMRRFLNSGPQEQGSLCFVYSGLKLAQNHIAAELNMKDGDVIDGFNE
ncbi:Small ubiquitin-related modifier 1 [Orobanche minor]